ncbi:MAG: biotin/lipoate A/B protein ligase family protein, partial [Candidatus Aminicenantales bacterium]
PKTYLRFYRWKRPTASIGYSQKVSKVVDIDYCRKNGIDIVRRITGGKMVLHHKEVTYSVCSSDEEIFPPNLAGSYFLVSRALMRGLERMGLHPSLADSSPDFYTRGNLPCFSYPARNEVEVMGKKIIGSAQKRVGSKFLQHGSIPLEEDEELLKSVSTLPEKCSTIRMISLHKALGKKVSFDWAVEHLKQGFSEFFRVRFRLKTFNSDEMDAIRQIQRQKYENHSWTFSYAGVRLS